MNIKVITSDLDYQGQGVTRIDDKVTFIKGMFHDEVGLIEILKSKKHFQEAKLTQLIKKNKDRTSDLYFDYAPLYGLSLAAECLWQEKITKETIKKITDLDVHVHKTITDGNKLNYRNKITLHVKRIGDSLKIGTFEEKSNFLQPITSHKLALPIINDKINFLNNWIKTTHINNSIIKNFTLRTNGKEVMLIIGVKSSFDELDDIIYQLKNEFQSIYINLEKNKFDNLSDESIHLYGKETLKMPFNHLEFELGPESFFQVNKEVAILMYEEIKKLTQNQIVIDAYAGMASIGQYITSKKVYSIESNLDSVTQANKMLINNQIKHLELIHGNVEEKLGLYINLADTIIFDPPRSGLTEDIIHLVKLHKVKDIIYISCDLKSLSRDINGLKDLYDIKKVIPVRMFPSTIHVENIVLLSLKTA
ncbi:23S rRNA (uracil(1939)-C(5))-methyltransferase RlmD [Acholeplasma granularum]|uniref:23S rRNA (uracil(1939)-C(5))-methyltransferase RlmD n=1 Tax=Acholeplasma granularum TaxID=264635 RepID=UPI00046F8BFC|nr:23S rRNA (uracil(1939)-C(5))-methyltransferase RlmD [Acholeplasma granularum]